MFFHIHLSIHKAVYTADIRENEWSRPAPKSTFSLHNLYINIMLNELYEKREREREWKGRGVDRLF